MKKITVIIPTRDRLESLKDTLRSLEAAHRSELEIEIVVVNNLEGEELEGSLTAFQASLNLVVLNEPKPGKSHALNRALAHFKVDKVDIVAVIDDDISVDPGWFEDMVAISARWPEKGFFSGSTRIEWPDHPIPEWSRHFHSTLRGWAFSINETKKERVLKPGHWVSGNHFWFHPQHLPHEFRFDCSIEPFNHYTTEPKMMFALTDLGHGGVLSPLATAKHRLQVELIDFGVLKERAKLAGRGFADAQLRPFHRCIRQSVLLNKHPLAGRLYCRLRWFEWFLRYLCSFVHWKHTSRVVNRLTSIYRKAHFSECLKICRKEPEYKLW